MSNTPPNLKAGGKIYPARFVMPDTSGDFEVIQATANGDVLGITRDETKHAPLSDLVTDNPHAEDGDNCAILGLGDVGLVELGGTVTRGDRLKSDGDGKAVSIATTGTTLQRFGARALQSGSSGEKIRVFCELGSERPALA